MRLPASGDAAPVRLHRLSSYWADCGHDTMCWIAQGAWCRVVFFCCLASLYVNLRTTFALVHASVPLKTTFCAGLGWRARTSGSGPPPPRCTPVIVRIMIVRWQSSLWSLPWLWLWSYTLP